MVFAQITLPIIEGIISQTNRIIVEGRGLIQRLDDAEPNLIGGFRSDHGVRAAIISEIKARASGITMQRWILHKPIVVAGAWIALI